MNGDSLVGAPRRKTYDAARSYGPKVERNPAPRTITYRTMVYGAIRDDEDHNKEVLRAVGRRIGRVVQVSPRCVDGTVPYDALRLLGWTDRTTVETTPDHLWRTLVADRTFDGSRAPSWWRRANMFVLSMASRDGDLNTQRLLQSKAMPLTVQEYLRRMQAIVWNRRVFDTESPCTDAEDASFLPVLVGIGPRDCRHGDVLCILLGCSVPVLLRERRSHFELVGECYVHGMMDGEALLSDQAVAEASITEFDLV